MSSLGIDIGTTHCKAGVFGQDGIPLKLASRPTPVHTGTYAYIKPDELWAAISEAIREVISGPNVSANDIEAVGITSMAETGILLDRQTGAPRSNFVPWFDTNATPQANFILSKCDPIERFLKTGLHISFKASISKLMWLAEHEKPDFKGAVWLSVADYVAYRLTGNMATDYSLAGRTCAFMIGPKAWDEAFLNQFGFDASIFPPPKPAGTVIGEVRRTAQITDDSAPGLADGTPVCIAGHDHVCAALAVGAFEPGPVFDSMGTAETLMGTTYERELTEQNFLSGLRYGCHVAPGRMYWMGSLSASGGSLEWIRTQLGVNYEQMGELLDQAHAGPTGILYLPHLLGGGFPRPDTTFRAAFIGLAATHTRSDLLKAVLEGTAYEMESIRRGGEKATMIPIKQIIAVGGGTRNSHWMQIKADVSGCHMSVWRLPEATLLGAALIAGVGAGVYRDLRAAFAATALTAANDITPILPNIEHHHQYKRLYEQGYLPVQEALRRYHENAIK